MNKYIASLPAFAINLDASPERWARLKEQASLFASLSRVPGIYGIEQPLPVLQEFAEHVNTSVEIVARREGVWMQYPGRATNDGLRTTYRNIREGTRSHKHVAGMYGTYTSHLHALNTALCHGHPRFLILEDDASMRDLPQNLEPPESEVNLWGSISMASFKTDARRMERGMPFHWVQPKTRYSCLLGTATEYTVKGAQTVYEIMRRLPLQWDTGWWEALRLLSVHKLEPAGFVQVGVSTFRQNKKVWHA